MAKSKRRNKTISLVFYMIYILVLLLIVGDIIGVLLFYKFDEVSIHAGLDYVYEQVNLFSQETWSFNDIFYEQFMYQGSIWLFGLSVIGVIINLFLVFLKGVIAGFNLMFIFETLPFWSAMLTMLLWFIQYALVLVVTVISGYFSIRFVFIVLRTLFVKKEPLRLKKQLVYYFYQLVMIMALTLVSTTVTYVIQPLTYEQFEKAETLEHEKSNVSDNLKQKDAEFDGVVL